jgi:hypothetical protein
LLVAIRVQSQRSRNRTERIGIASSWIVLLRGVATVLFIATLPPRANIPELVIMPANAKNV